MRVAYKSPLTGCDFTLFLPESREGTPIKLLQLTDTQIIDAAQQRPPDRLRPDEVAAWGPEMFDRMCGDHIRSLVAQTRPDLIFLTGDLVYGSFDDSGRSLEWFCRLMDSFRIPWAPVFGNHDNESAKGVRWQCGQLEKSDYCLFERGTVSGNGNYSVGIAVGERLVRVLHMVDSNGCRHTTDPEVITAAGIYPDQLERIARCTREITAAQGHPVPAFMAFHIPVESFAEAERESGYLTDARPFYTIGVDMPARPGDFGFREEGFRPIKLSLDFIPFLHEQGIEAVFVGHAHDICTCIAHKGVRWVFGLKTGQYDYHVPGQIGGTLVTLQGAHFDVAHVPALVPMAPMPAKAWMFDDFFVKE